MRNALSTPVDVCLYAPASLSLAPSSSHNHSTPNSASPVTTTAPQPVFLGCLPANPSVLVGLLASHEDARAYALCVRLGSEWQWSAPLSLFPGKAYSNLLIECMAAPATPSAASTASPIGSGSSSS